MQVNGDLLKGKIRAKGYTYETLSKASIDRGYNLSVTSISNTVNNVNNPSYLTIVALHEMLGLTAEESNCIFFDKELHKTGK